MRHSAAAETRLLLFACRPHPHPKALRGLLKADIEWERVSRRAVDLGIGPLLFHRLRNQNCLEVIPDEQHQILTHCYYEQASRNARLYDRLEQSLAMFVEAGVEVVVLKGAALAEPVYGDIALRPIDGLDLLILRKDRDRANELLQSKGFRPVELYPPVTWSRKRSHQLAPLASPDGSIVIELHWHIVSPGSGVKLEAEELWARVRTTAIGATVAFVLSPEDLLFHICTYHTLSREFVGGLRTLCDIAVILDRFGEEFDWDLFVSLCVASGVPQHVLHPLEWSRALVGAACPAPVLETLDRYAANRIGHGIIDSLGRRVIHRSTTDPSFVPPWLINTLLGELLATPERPLQAVWRMVRGLPERKGRGDLSTSGHVSSRLSRRGTRPRAPSLEASRPPRRAKSAKREASRRRS